MAKSPGISKPDRKIPNKKNQFRKNEEKKRLEELIAAVTSAAEAKGWRSSLIAMDEKNFRYATISVSRQVSYETVSATFEITCDEKVALSAHKTSFHGYGIVDLRDAAWNEIRKLPWLSNAKKDQTSDSSWHLPVIKKLLRNFHRTTRQLKHRYDSRPSFLIEDEYDVQDLLHAILRGLFDDVRPEEYTPSYAGGASRMDFFLKKEELVIEIKMASEKLRDKQVGEQLLIDIARYRAHPGCKHLVCFVYDPHNNLKNPGGLETDLGEKSDALEVTVIVVSPS